MAIPAKLSPILSKKKDQTEIFKLLKRAIDEVLEELSDFQTVFGYGVDNEGKTQLICSHGFSKCYNHRQK